MSVFYLIFACFIGLVDSAIASSCCGDAADFRRLLQAGNAAEQTFWSGVLGYGTLQQMRPELVPEVSDLRKTRIQLGHESKDWDRICCLQG